ncbi:MAG: Rrf2 family transcriptional regulator [Candidatus Azambacteria bacterium]|nr:Rrf2 family transcriptional regulator [Candidatus Azambacteria bacterium]
MISRKTDYSLILMQALKPTFTSGDFMTLEGIAKQYRLPHAYCEKLAHKLKEAGILASRVGKNGGYRLAKDPKKISVQSLVDVFQKQQPIRCLLAPNAEKSCALALTCPTKKGWLRIDTEIRKTLTRLTIANI